MSAQEVGDPVAGESSPRPYRILVLDALRGLALALMALDHASYCVGVRLVAEHYAGYETRLWGWACWSLGLLTNVAAPTFWFASGVSISLFEAARRRMSRTERQISRYFSIRALFLVGLDLTFIAVFTGLLVGKAWAYEFDVLSALGVSLLLLAHLRRLPDGVLALGAAGLLLAYPLIVGRWSLGGRPGGTFWLSLWFDFTKADSPSILFPVLGWIPLMVLGLVVGRRFSSPRLRSPTAWLVGLAPLVPLATAYRRLKKAHPESVLQYL